jgi:hypothetical protein
MGPRFRHALMPFRNVLIWIILLICGGVLGVLILAWVGTAAGVKLLGRQGVAQQQLATLGRPRGHTDANGGVDSAWSAGR